MSILWKYSGKGKREWEKAFIIRNLSIGKYMNKFLRWGDKIWSYGKGSLMGRVSDGSKHFDNIFEPLNPLIWGPCYFHISFSFSHAGNFSWASCIWNQNNLNRKEDCQLLNTKCEIFLSQTKSTGLSSIKKQHMTKTRQRQHTKKLQANITDEHRCKNPQQNFSKQNSTTH